MAGALSRRRAGAADYTWPGYVDALTTLLMVLIFLLSIFSVAQFTLSTTLSSRESAIDILNQQVGTLASQLSLEKKSAEELKQTAEQKANVVRLAAEMATLKDELAKLNAALEAADAKAKEQNAQIVDL